jgi:hypothetical protein
MNNQSKASRRRDWDGLILDLDVDLDLDLDLNKAFVETGCFTTEAFDVLLSLILHRVQSMQKKG